MAKDEALTKDNLLDVLAEFFDGLVKPEFNRVGQRFDKIDKNFELVENRLANINLEIKGLKNEVNGLKAEFSTSPSREEFNKLKQQVDRYHPTS